MSHLTTSKGITLIELLVIVVILGIFSGIGYVSFTSVDTGSNFRANKETITSYLERIRFKAFSDGKHYKVRLENVGNDMQIKLYQPDSSNIKWRDLNLNRRCNCWSGTGNSDTNCNNAFSNSSISSLTEVDGFTKDLKKVVCGAANAKEGLITIYGSSPRDTHFKLTNNEELNLIIKLNKTGYAE